MHEHTEIGRTTRKDRSHGGQHGVGALCTRDMKRAAAMETHGRVHSRQSRQADGERLRQDKLSLCLPGREGKGQAEEL